MKILVLSDTHIPRTAQDLPQAVYDRIPDVDMILHAGDFVEKEVLDKLSALRETKAVYGNMDSAQLRAVLNPKEIVEVEGCRIGLIHGYGATANIVDTVRKEFTDVDAVVFGHSHNAVNVTKSGVLFFNPGSPTDTIFAPFNSYGILEVSGKKITAELIKI